MNEDNYQAELIAKNYDNANGKKQDSFLVGLILGFIGGGVALAIIGAIGAVVGACQ